MKIAVIGASAGLGLETVKQALNNGYMVKALSRNTNTINDHSLLRKIDGSADNVEDLKKTIADTQATIIAVGTKQKKGTTLFSDIAKSLIKACEEVNYEGQVFVISGFGTGKSHKYASFFIKAIIYLFLKDQYRDKTLMEEIISKSNLNWEILQPGILTDKPLSKSYTIYTNLEIGMKVGKISRADIAHYLLKEIENPQNLKKYVAISNA